MQNTVLITGATSGIGLATARLFAQNHDRIILCGRRQDRLEAIRSDLELINPGNTYLLCFDIRNYSEVEKAINSLPDEWSAVDILINNAGLAKGFHPIHEGHLQDWETMIDTNLKGLLYVTRLISPDMVARQKGHIINVCSTAGHEVYPNGNVYSATKFAVQALTKSIRLDLYKTGVKVSQVSPGHVEETEFALVRFEGDKEKASIYNDFTPLNARDVADSIYYIASRPAHVNIQEILIMSSQQAGSNFIDRSGRK
jgi:NADP-dependent 3-hydroxy acid dehydrogenase YdfG